MEYDPDDPDDFMVIYFYGEILAIEWGIGWEFIYPVVNGGSDQRSELGVFFDSQQIYSRFNWEPFEATWCFPTI